MFHKNLLELTISCHLLHTQPALKMLATGRQARIRSSRSSGKIKSTETALTSLLPSSLSSENESSSQMPLVESSKQLITQDVSPSMMKIEAIKRDLGQQRWREMKMRDKIILK